MPQPSVLSLLAAMLLVAGCSAPPPFDAAVSGPALLRRDAEWSALASAGRDVDRTASYWTDDALIIPQGQPVIEGKAAIRAFVAASFQTPGFNIRWTSEKPVFSPDGKLAYLRSTTTTTVPGPNGTPVAFPSRGMTIWRLEKDGQWRCVVDIWNDPPPAPAVAVKPMTAPGGTAPSPSSR